MPYKTRKVRNKNCYRVYNPVNKKTFAKCSSKKNAIKQMRLLRAIQYNQSFKTNPGIKTRKKQYYTRKNK